jgi:gamma-glutamylcyclotransferase (GGCT)/AIG2-like uncharacterized protein YtfP
MEKETRRIAVYGSLRRSEYNYPHFAGGLNYVTTLTVPGYRLYSLGPYPAVIESEDDTDTVVVELFEADDYTDRRIAWMEEGAGYHAGTITHEGEDYTIWLFPPERAATLTHVPSGDWSAYLEAQRSKKEEHETKSSEV